jgi:hypothetical protein
MMLLLDLRTGRSSLFPPLCPSFLSLHFTCFFLFLFRRFFGPVRDPYTYSLAVRVLGLRTPLIAGTWPIDWIFTRQEFASTNL